MYQFTIYGYFAPKTVVPNDNHSCQEVQFCRTGRLLVRWRMCWWMIQHGGMGFLLKICWSIESKLDRSKMRRCKLACKRLIFTSGQFGESQTPRKAKLFEVAWTKNAAWHSLILYCIACFLCYKGEKSDEIYTFSQFKNTIDIWFCNNKMLCNLQLRRNNVSW